MYFADDGSTTVSQALAAAGLYAVIVAFGACAVMLARRAAGGRLGDAVSPPSR